MFFSWRKARRRKELLAEPFPSVWQEHLVNNVRHYTCLDVSKQAIVQAVVRVVVAEKDWSGGEHFQITDEMKVTIAGQASLLVLGLEEPYFFDRVHSIILHPGPYVRPRSLRRLLNSSRRTVYSGEAWYHSPIVLSWQDVLRAGHDASDGGNVVLHEFAHYLDGLDGDFNGTPPLADREQERNWYRVTEAEYRRLVGATRRREVTLLDHYGATNKAEFFAVATECFFERPHAMQQQYSELYAVLRAFYRQDPAQWMPDATTTTLETSWPRAELNEETATDILQSEDADALFTFAVTCLNDRRYELAEKAASRAIELDPTDGEVYQHRAEARVKLGKYMAALEDSNQAMRLDDSDLDAKRTRGAAYVGLQQFELAKADLDCVLRDDRNDAEAYRQRGSALLGLNQFERALSDFSMAIALDPLSAEAYYQRGLASRRLGRMEDANVDLEKALQLDPRIGW